MVSDHDVRAFLDAYRSEPYPRELPDDVRSLSEQLEASNDRPIRLWNVGLTSGIVFVVYELIDDGRIAGVVKSFAATHSHDGSSVS